MKTAISRLTRLGFTHYEARAYTALLQDNPLTAYEIAKNSGIPTSKVYEVIRKLEGRNTIQSIRGTRTRLFIPVSPDEFVENYKLTVESNLHVVRDALKGVKVGIDTHYTWHIKEYDDFMLRAGRMLRAARESVLLLTWPEEVSGLVDELRDAQERDVNIAIMHYGPTRMKIGQVYLHPAEETMYAQRGCRNLTLVRDSREALIGKFRGRDTEGIWSMNEVFVINAEEYIRHDIYLMKTAARFNPVMQKAFGKRYEKLVNVFEDEVMS